MSVAPVESPSTIDTGGFTEELIHVVCECSPDVAFCETAFDDDEFEEVDGADCVVCLDLIKWPCVRCGL